MARIRHPNVVTIYGADRTDDRVGLWMELLDGRTLEQELHEHGPFDAATVARIGVDLCRALGAVHGAGLLHRDLKTQNVMRDASGDVRLTDFGAGRQVGPDDSIAHGELAGTLYLAPEVLAGNPASVRSDLYSLGVLLYHLATGDFPVRGRSLVALKEAHHHGERTSLRTARPDFPKPLAAAIDRALDKNPNGRHQDAVEIESALAGSGPQPLIARRRTWMAAALIVVLSGAGLATWLLRSPTAGQQLQFHPRDLVLITRFDNRTGEPVFDGAIEYALERELTNSDVVGLVPRERVDDALVLMKRDTSTIVRSGAKWRSATVGSRRCWRVGSRDSDRPTS